MTQPKKPVTPERLKKLEASRKRMQEVVDDFKMNASELEVYLKITHSLIFNVLNMRNAMTKTVAKPLSNKYGYNYEWLMYGTGPKKKTKRIMKSKEIQTSEHKGCIDKNYFITGLKSILEEQKKTNKLLEELINK